MRRERYHEFAFVRAGDIIRRGPCSQQACVECGVLIRQSREERPVQPHQAVTRREVGKAETEA